MRFGRLAAMVAAVAGAGCTNAARDVVDKPSDITLVAALESTVDAIYAARLRSAARRAQIGGSPLGLNVCDFTAVFNIAARGTDTRTGSVTASTPPNLYVSLSATGSRTDTATASRGNQVTVRFTSPACNPPDTLGTKSPKDVVLLEREIEAARAGAPDPLHTGAAPPARRPRQATTATGEPATATTNPSPVAPGGGPQTVATSVVHGKDPLSIPDTVGSSDVSKITTFGPGKIPPSLSAPN